MNRTIKIALALDLGMAALMAVSTFLSVTGVFISFTAALLLFLTGLGFGVAALGKNDIPNGLQILGLLGPFLAFLPVILVLVVFLVSAAPE